MADTTALKNRIRAAIKANDNQEITGPVLQQALLDMVDELNGATETESQQRQTGDSTLQQGINTERQARIDADNALGQRITNEIQQEAQRAEAAFDDLDLSDVAGSELQATQITLCLKKNDGSEQDPDWRTLAELILPPATTQRAGLMSAADKRELSEGLKDYINVNIQKLPILVSKYSIQIDTWYGESYNHIVIPVNGGDSISFTTAANVLYCAFLTSYEKPVADATPNFVPGYTSRQSKVGNFIIPDGTKYLIVNNIDSADNALTALSVNGVDVLDGVFSALSKFSKQANTSILQAIANNSFANCYTSPAVAAKAVADVNLPNLTKSKYLRILVKFASKTTADDCTFSTLIGTYPLYYKGARASSTNSWEDGDTLDMRFDIDSEIWYAELWNEKTHVIESVEVANDKNKVANSDATAQALQLLPIFLFRYSIQGLVWYGVLNNHIVIPVTPGSKLQLTSSNNYTYFAFLKTYTRPMGGNYTPDNITTPDWATGYESRQGTNNNTIHTIPSDCHYLVINNPYNNAEEYLQHVYINDCDILEGIWNYCHNISKKHSDDITTLTQNTAQAIAQCLKNSDLTLKQSTINIANQNNVVNQMIDTYGNLQNTDGSWKALVIPLTSADAGKKITVGGFYMGRGGYANFFNGDTKIYEGPLGVADAQGTQNPTTFTVPENCTKLVVDIVSPLAPENPYEELMANWGETLLPFEPYYSITKIKNYGIAGTADVSELQDDVSELQDDVSELQASIGNVIYDLPVSDGTNIQTGYAYINSSDGVVKVKMS